MTLLVAVCCARPAVDDTLEDNDDLETAQQFYDLGYGGYQDYGYGYPGGYDGEFYEQRKYTRVEFNVCYILSRSLIEFTGTHIGADGSFDTDTIDFTF